MAQDPESGGGSYRREENAHLRKTEADAEPAVAAAMASVLDVNHRQPGQYILVIQAEVSDTGTWKYQWRWFWSPAAPWREGTGS